MDILRVKDGQGQWRDVPALVGPQGEPGPQGPAGKDGADGVSPAASVEQTASGATITVTDAQGTTTANLTNGQDGQDGSPGTDGADGQSAYVWIRYSVTQPTQDSDMKTTPDAWMGIYSGDSATAPTAYTAYTWYNIKGQTGPVSDVQINGSSVVSGGVANVPVATGSRLGVVQGNPTGGTQVLADGRICVAPASEAEIKAGSSSYKPTAQNRNHIATFYGLAKAAGSDEKNSTLPVGNYTDAAKSAIQHMLGTDTNLAPYEPDTTADAAYAIGEMFMLNGKLHQATAAIAVGDTLTVGANCAVVNASEVFPHDVKVNGTSVVSGGVANVPIVGNEINRVGKTVGVVCFKDGYCYGFKTFLNGNDYCLAIKEATESGIKTGKIQNTNGYGVIDSTNINAATFYGLAKAAGDTTQSQSSNPVGTYTDEAKAAIKAMLGVSGGGSSTLDGLSDVNVSGAEVGDSIIYLGSGWTPGAPIKSYEIEDDGNGNPCIYSLYDIVRYFNAGYFIDVFDPFGTDESPNYTVTNAVSYTDGDGNTVDICELQRMKPNGKIEKRIFADRWDETLQDTIYREETPTGMVSNTIALTQAEYDTLVNAGTVDPQTLYCIKESGS